MVLGLKDKIEAIIEDKTNYAKSMPKRYKDRVKDLNNRKNTARYTEQGFKEIVQKRLDEVKTQYDEYKVSCRQKVQAVIGKAKQDVENNLNATVANTTDYDVRFNTAMMTLINMNLQNIDDDTSYMILGDFVEDNAKMRICRMMIENQGNMLVRSDGTPAFEKTFGHLIAYESVINQLNALEKESEKMFVDTAFEADTNIIMVGGDEQWHDGSMVGGYKFRVPRALDVMNSQDAFIFGKAKEIDAFVKAMEGGDE